MTADQERWAEALAIQRRHGEDAAGWIAARIAELGLAGDMDGLLRFRDIATRYDQLLAASVQ